ncbi:18939_t:CDS:1, partial [Funneliformis geosporum]
STRRSEKLTEAINNVNNKNEKPKHNCEEEMNQQTDLQEDT